LVEELSEKYLDLVTDTGQVVGELDSLANNEPNTQPGPERRELQPRDIGGIVERLNTIRSAATGIRRSTSFPHIFLFYQLLINIDIFCQTEALASGLRQRANALPEREWHELRDLRTNSLEQIERVVSHSTDLASDVDNLLSRNLPSLAPRALQFARDLAKSTLVRRVGLALTALKWLTTAINLVLDEVGDDDPTETGGGGGGPVISVVIPVTPTTTPVATPTFDPTVPPTTLPDEYYVVIMSQDTQPSGYTDVVTEIIEDGGVIFGLLTFLKEKHWSIWGLIQDQTMPSLSLNPLVGCISRNHQLLDEDERKTAGATGGAPARREIDVDLVGAASNSVASHTTSRTNTTTKNKVSSSSSGTKKSKLRTRALPGQFEARRVGAPSAEGGRPTILRQHAFLNSIWSKTWLEGGYRDIADYWLDTEGSDRVPVYLIDKQVDWAHPDLAPLGAARNYPGWDCYTGTAELAMRRWGCKDIGRNPTPPGAGTAEEGYHGTEMAALIGGHISGVNPHVNLVPLRSGPYGKSRVHHAVAAMAQIEKLQSQNGGQHAVVSASFGYKKESASLNLPPGSGTKTDAFEYMIPRLQRANADFVFAVANIDLEKDPEGTKTTAVDYSPDWLGGDHAADAIPIFAIAVGNCDINGHRAPGSSFLYDTPGSSTDPTNHKYPDVYNIGSGLLHPTKFIFEDPAGEETIQYSWAERPGGTSHATALTSGLLSLLIARDPGTFSSAGAPTKQGLQSLARRKKGPAWPPDSPDYTAGWSVPRAATDWEIPCDPDPAGGSGTNVPGPERPNVRDLNEENDELFAVDLTVDVLAGPAEYQNYLAAAPCVSARPGRLNPPV
jgi:hypothetical protein